MGSLPVKGDTCLAGLVGLRSADVALQARLVSVVVVVFLLRFLLGHVFTHRTHQAALKPCRRTRQEDPQKPLVRVRSSRSLWQTTCSRSSGSSQSTSSTHRA